MGAAWPCEPCCPGKSEGARLRSVENKGGGGRFTADPHADTDPESPHNRGEAPVVPHVRTSISRDNLAGAASKLLLKPLWPSPTLLLTPLLRPKGKIQTGGVPTKDKPTPALRSEPSLQEPRPAAHSFGRRALPGEGPGAPAEPDCPALRQASVLGDLSPEAPKLWSAVMAQNWLPLHSSHPGGRVRSPVQILACL